MVRQAIIPLSALHQSDLLLAKKKSVVWKHAWKTGGELEFMCVYIYIHGYSLMIIIYHYI